MAIAFKLIMGASAISSVMIIAATERGEKFDPVPIKHDTISVMEDRFPFVIVMPKQDRERLTMPPPKQQPAHASAEVQKVQSGHNRKLRTTSCRRSYFYVKGHRYWSCKRA